MTLPLSAHASSEQGHSTAMMPMVVQGKLSAARSIEALVVVMKSVPAAVMMTLGDLTDDEGL